MSLQILLFNDIEVREIISTYFLYMQIYTTQGMMSICIFAYNITENAAFSQFSPWKRRRLTARIARYFYAVYYIDISAVCEIFILRRHKCGRLAVSFALSETIACGKEPAQGIIGLFVVKQFCERLLHSQSLKAQL